MDDIIDLVGFKSPPKASGGGNDNGGAGFVPKSYQEAVEKQKMDREKAEQVARRRAEIKLVWDRDKHETVE